MMEVSNSLLWPSAFRYSTRPSGLVRSPLLSMRSLRFSTLLKNSFAAIPAGTSSGIGRNGVTTCLGPVTVMQGGAALGRDFGQRLGQPLAHAGGGALSVHLDESRGLRIA